VRDILSKALGAKLRLNTRLTVALNEI